MRGQKGGAILLEECQGQCDKNLCLARMMRSTTKDEVEEGMSLIIQATKLKTEKMDIDERSEVDMVQTIYARD